MHDAEELPVTALWPCATLLEGAMNNHSFCAAVPHRSVVLQISAEHARDSSWNINRCGESSGQLEINIMLHDCRKELHRSLRKKEDICLP